MLTLTHAHTLMYTHTLTHMVHTCPHTYSCTRVHTLTLMHTHLYTLTYAHVHTCILVHIHMHTHAHSHTCTHSCTLTHMNTLMHPHTRAHTQQLLGEGAGVRTGTVRHRARCWLLGRTWGGSRSRGALLWASRPSPQASAQSVSGRAVAPPAGGGGVWTVGRLGSATWCPHRQATLPICREIPGRAAFRNVTA